MNREKLKALLKELLIELEKEEKEENLPFMPIQLEFPIQEDSRGCLIDAYFRNHPNETACMISCPCPKCSPRC